GRGVEGEQAAVLAGEAEPPSCENSEAVAVGEDQDVAVRFLDIDDDAVHPAPDMCGGLTAGAAVRPEIPVGALLSDLLRREAVVLAVVELDEAIVDLRLGEPGKASRPARTPQRAREHAGELVRSQHLGERSSLILALRGQIDVGLAGVLSIAGPLGFAVADDPDLHRATAGTRSGRPPSARVRSPQLRRCRSPVR